MSESEFHTFSTKQDQRCLVDSKGYLEACLGTHDTDPIRFSETILSPQKPDHFLGAPTYHTLNDNMRGDVKRLPQNLLMFNPPDEFSPHMFTTITNRSIPKIKSVFIGNEEAEMYGNKIPQNKFIVKYKIVKTHFHLQICDLPKSRSEFRQLLTMSLNIPGVQTLLDPDEFDFPKEDVFDERPLYLEKEDGYKRRGWFDDFIRLNKLTQDQKKKDLIKQILLQNASNLVYIKLRLVKEDDTNEIQFTQNDNFDDLFKMGHLENKPKDDFVHVTDKRCHNCVFLMKIKNEMITPHNNVTLKNNEMIVVKKVRREWYTFNVYLENGWLSWEDAIIVPSIDVIRSHVYNIFHQSKTQYEKHHHNSEFVYQKLKYDSSGSIGGDDGLKIKVVYNDQQVDFRVGNNQPDTDNTYNIQLDKFHIQGGFVYTTDLGIRTGVPFTHSSSKSGGGPHMNMIRTASLKEISLPHVHNLMNNCAILKLHDARATWRAEMDASGDVSKHNNCTERYGFFVIFGFLQALRKIIQSKSIPNMLVCDLSINDLSYEAIKELVIIRCQIMAILKMFPLIDVNGQPSLEHERFSFHVYNAEFVNPSDCEAIMLTVPNHKHLSVKVKLIEDFDGKCDKFELGRAFSSSLEFNQAQLKRDDLKLHFEKVKRSYDVLICEEGGNLKCLHMKAERWTACTVLGMKNDKTQRITCFLNKLKPLVQKKCINDDEMIVFEHFHSYVDMIPFQLESSSEGGKIKYLSNRKFDHPHIIFSPTSAVYRCTESLPENTHVLLRPFPSSEEIESMISYLKEKGLLLFEKYPSNIGVSLLSARDE